MFCLRCPPEQMSRLLNTELTTDLIAMHLFHNVALKIMTFILKIDERVD